MSTVIVMRAILPSSPTYPAAPPGVNLHLSDGNPPVRRAPRSGTSEHDQQRNNGEADGQKNLCGRFPTLPSSEINNIPNAPTPPTPPKTVPTWYRNAPAMSCP